MAQWVGPTMVKPGRPGFSIGPSPERGNYRVFVAAVWPAGAISCGWRESPRTPARECPEAEATLRSRRTTCRVELANPRFQ